MAKYGTKLTTVGIAKLANAQVTSSKVQITHIAVGDGNGVAYTPTGAETALKREQWRGTVNKAELGEGNTIIVEGIVPATAGGFTMREVGLYDADGAMIAIGNYPDTEKTTVASGVTGELILRTIIKVANTSTVDLTINTDLVTATKSDIDGISAQLAHIAIDVKQFGAVGDNATDDINALELAVNATPIGGTLIVPDGLYRTTRTWVINKNINVEMFGTISADHEDIAIDVDGLGIGNTFIPQLRLKTIKKTQNHLADSIGVRLKKSYGIFMRVDYSGRFTTGLQLIGADGRGCVYNEISLGQIHNSKKQIHLTTDSNPSSWVNQNTFLGGRLYYSSTGDRTDCVQIQIDGDVDSTPLYRNNGNVFIGTSLEDIGSAGQYAKAVQCNGHSNSFISLRTEGSMTWEFAPQSFRNFVNGGCYISMGNIIDNGLNNTIETVGTGSKRTVQTGSNKFVAGANGTTGIEAYGHGQTRIPAKFYNTSSNGYPTIQLMETDGETMAAQFAANGNWIVKNGDRRVCWGVYVAAPTSGDWKRGDIVFITNPSDGQPIGYICVSSGSPGTWIPFGGRALTQVDSTATDVATLKADFNSLLAKMRAAGLLKS